MGRTDFRRGRQRQKKTTQQQAAAGSRTEITRLSRVVVGSLSDPPWQLLLTSPLSVPGAGGERHLSSELVQKIGLEL